MSSFSFCSVNWVASSITAMHNKRRLYTFLVRPMLCIGAKFGWCSGRPRHRTVMIMWRWSRSNSIALRNRVYAPTSNPRRRLCSINGFDLIALITCCIVLRSIPLSVCPMLFWVGAVVHKYRQFFAPPRTALDLSFEPKHCYRMRTVTSSTGALGGVGTEEDFACVGANPLWALWAG